MPLEDDSLCGQTANAGEVNRSTGACCHIATVDNVNLLTGELTVTFVATPPEPFSAQVIIPGANVRYNCGLCYTGGLGTNLPAFGYERDDSVLVLVPRGWVPEGEFDTQGLFVVGHEFAIGVEDQKACGQMGRMIIQPGDDTSATNGYGAPFLEEVVVDGVVSCVPVNPFADSHLGVEVGMGTLNGTGRHLMVYGDSEDLVAVRPYLFPNGSSFNGRLELTHYVSDEFFPYGFRAMISGAAAYASGSSTVTLSVKLQGSRAIGTNGYSYSSGGVLTVASAAGDADSAFPMFQPFGVDVATGNILMQNHGTGIKYFTATFDPAAPSLTYPSTASGDYLLEPAAHNIPSYPSTNRTVESESYSRRHTQHTGTYVEVSGGTNDQIWTPLAASFTAITNGENSITISIDCSKRIESESFRWYDTRTPPSTTRSTTTTVNSAMAAVYFDGVLLGRMGLQQTMLHEVETASSYDGGDICGPENDDPPPVTPTPETPSVYFTGTWSQRNLWFVYVSIKEKCAVFIRSTASDSVTRYLVAPSMPSRDNDITFELCLYKNGTITVLDTYSYSPGAEPDWSNTATDTGGPYFNFGGGYADSSVVDSDSGTTWQTGAGSSCTWTSGGATTIYYDTTPRSIVYVSDECAAMGASSPIAYGVDGTWYNTQRSSVTRLPFFGQRPSQFSNAAVVPIFNEFAKSDDGELMYFSIPKLEKIGTATADEDFIRVLIRGGTVSTDAKAILEAATGLIHSQAGLRFAPY